MNTHGVYRVTGDRAYRGHRKGREFVARLDPLAEQRALQRGDIVLLERLTPRLPKRFELPDGWLPTDVPSPQTEPAPAGSLISGRE